jgi:hypothetical protein
MAILAVGGDPLTVAGDFRREAAIGFYLTNIPLRPGSRGVVTLDNTMTHTPNCPHDIHGKYS